MECTIFRRRFFVKKIGEISSNYANASNRLFVQTNMSGANKIFGKDKLAKKKAISKSLTKVKDDGFKKAGLKRYKGEVFLFKGI
jgi:hypothetical protein